MVRVAHGGHILWSRPGKVGRDGAVEHLRRMFEDYAARKAEWRKRFGLLGLRELAKMEGKAWTR